MLSYTTRHRARRRQPAISPHSPFPLLRHNSQQTGLSLSLSLSVPSPLSELLSVTSSSSFPALSVSVGNKHDWITIVFIRRHRTKKKKITGRAKKNPFNRRTRLQVTEDCTRFAHLYKWCLLLLLFIHFKSALGWGEGSPFSWKGASSVFLLNVIP